MCHNMIRCSVIETMKQAITMKPMFNMIILKRWLKSIAHIFHIILLVPSILNQ